MSAIPIFAFLGDSLTLGGTGVELHDWPSRLDINTTLFPQLGIANFGVSGDQSSGFLSRYTAEIKGKGFAGLSIQGCINDVTNGVLATVSWANVKAIVDDWIANEPVSKPLFLVATSPAGSSAGFTAPMLVQQVALKEDFAAYALANPTRITFIDLSVPYPLGMGDPVAPANLYPPFNVGLGDGKHYGVAGNEFLERDIWAPVLGILFPAHSPAPEPETLSLFGVDPHAVRRHHFANWQYDFSGTTTPTFTTVEEMIADAAGELAGRLTEMEIDPTTITVDSAAYVQLRNVLRKTVAVRVMEDATDQDSALLTKWQDQLDAFWKRVEDKGPATLGNESLSSSASEPEGPTTHLDELSIDLGDVAGDASDGVPPFRKDDQL